MTTARPPILDATPLFAPEDFGERDVARVLAGRSGLAGMVRLGRRGIEQAEVASRRPDPPDALATLRKWLVDGGARPVPARLAQASGTLAWVRRALPAWRPPPREPTLPPRAALIRVGWRGWSSPHLQALLDRRPDLAALAVIELPIGLDWPEYDSAADAATLHRDLAALGRTARAIVAPDDSARTRLLLALADHAPTIHVEPPPSVLATTEAPVFDAALAAVPYMIAPGPIEARANSLLLLQLWRALAREGGVVPKLVLAGARGHQIEEIKPLLDWNPALAGHLVEAPDLPPQALRHLMAHARAVLRPAFVEHSCALTRDAIALGLPVITATTLSPIDGKGWLDALKAYASRPVVGLSPMGLPDGTSYAERITGLAETLP